MPIRRLSEEMVNRIAAGEVVERPASVVKELVENAIDAGARRIEIATAAGGIGADPRHRRRRGHRARTNSTLAVERHCTSKLDGGLDDIATLGFRGEALAAIGSAARLTIALAAQGSGGRLRDRRRRRRGSAPVRPTALAGGTRVEVRDLFFATPARLKFLKSERAEAAAISETVKRIAHGPSRDPLQPFRQRPADPRPAGGDGRGRAASSASAR